MGTSLPGSHKTDWTRMPYSTALRRAKVKGPAAQTLSRATSVEASQTKLPVEAHHPLTMLSTVSMDNSKAGRRTRAHRNSKLRLLQRESHHKQHKEPHRVVANQHLLLHRVVANLHKGSRRVLIKLHQVPQRAVANAHQATSTPAILQAILQTNLPRRLVKVRTPLTMLVET